jgi:predicted SAM-dependent methyltransferase
MTKKNEVVVKEKKAIKLNLGSGYRKIEGYVNIDNREECFPDLLCDVRDGLPFEDNAVEEVRCWDFLEHIAPNKVVFVMEEIYRVLKAGGKFEFMVPSTDGRGAFQDPTHVSFWNSNSFLYYSDEAHRNLYGIKAHFNFKTLTNLVSSNVLHIIHVHGIGEAVKD